MRLSRAVQQRIVREVRIRRLLEGNRNLAGTQPKKMPAVITKCALYDSGSFRGKIGVQN
jgi:hypothetical protein